MKKSSLLYRIHYIFVFMFLIELGFGTFNTLTETNAWHTEPVNFVANYSMAPGEINPFLFATPLLGLLAIITLLTSLKSKGVFIRDVRMSSLIAIFIVAVTFTYFVPVLIKVFGNKIEVTDKEPMNSDEIISYANAWFYLNWLRLLLALAGVIIGLRGLLKFYAVRHPNIASVNS